MQLNQFDGGLSSRVDPTLIKQNEGVTYTNVDNTALVLKSALGYTPLMPTQTARNSFYNFNGVWKSSFLDRDYVEYNSVLYYTEQDTVPKKDNGTVTQLLGIVAPGPQPAFDDSGDPIVDDDGNQVTHLVVSDAAATGGETGLNPGASVTVQYCYTYYNSDDGTESAPSALSDEVSIASGHVAVVTNFATCLDPQVDKMRLYRIDDNVTVMTLVAEFSVTTDTYRDTVKSVNLTTQLDTFSNQTPPSGLVNLTEAYGILFGSLGTKLYFTRVGLPNYWPAANFLVLPKVVTGILPIQGGILVFTIDRTFQLSGTTPDTFAIAPISTEQGCNSMKSCKLVHNIPVWSSLDGICAWENGYVEVLTKDKLGKITLNVKNCAVYDETYYINTSDGNLIAVDNRFGGLVIKEYDFDDDIIDIGTFNGVLYAIINNLIYTLFSGDPLPLQYKSGELTEGTVSNTKLYNEIYVKVNGLFTIKLFIDGEEVLSRDSNGKLELIELKPPAEKQRGTTIQFGVTGTGTVYEIEYKVLGRQNGR